MPKSRLLVFRPIAVLAFFFQTVFYYLFYSENRYSLQSPLDQFLLTFGWGVIYFFGMYFFLGRPLHFLVLRNIPIVYGFGIYFISMATIEASFGHTVIRVDQTVRDFLWHVFSTVAAVAPAIIICSFYFENSLRNIFGYDAEKVPYWKPIVRDINVLQSLLPVHKRGPVLRLQAANQYVEVTTDKGTHELRATLKSLLVHVPEKDGIHLQRSVWLRKDQIKEFGYDRGNPRVIDIDGNSISVSRQKVSDVKRVLDHLDV